MDLRDLEIQRISKYLEAGTHLEHLSLVSRIETDETIIVQLHDRLEAAGANLAKGDAAMRHTRTVEAELRDSKKAVLVR